MSTPLLPMTTEAVRFLRHASRDTEWHLAYVALELADRLETERKRAERELYRTEKRPLTRRQRELYDWICGFYEIRQYMPSFEEIARAFGFRSLATVHEHMTNLERKGWIKRGYNLARDITLVTEAPPLTETA